MTEQSKPNRYPRGPLLINQCKHCRRPIFAIRPGEWAHLPTSDRRSVNTLCPSGLATAGPDPGTHTVHARPELPAGMDLDAEILANRPDFTEADMPDGDPAAGLVWALLVSVAALVAITVAGLVLLG